MFHLTREETNFSTESRQILENLYREQTSVTLKKGRFIRMETEDIFIVYRGLVQLNMLRPNGGLFRILYADLAGINEFWRLSALL
jgi:hypothetical protein